MAEVSMERHGRAKQLVVFFGAAGIGTRGGWGADVVLRACCKLPGSHTASRLRAKPSTPLLAKRSKRNKAEQAAKSTQPTEGKGKAKGKAAKAKLAPQSGTWLDRDCNAGLGWAGLGWAGLGWAGLGWAGLGWEGRWWQQRHPTLALAYRKVQGITPAPGCFLLSQALRKRAAALATEEKAVVTSTVNAPAVSAIVSDIDCMGGRLMRQQEAAKA
ncbi:hypothetical protein QJQ45_017088 [Haematococcus lacustris]|nr:hypothetical protein QJQ45_017088 [Haematococcus lacustris]